MFVTAFLLTNVVCLVIFYLWTIKNRYGHFKRQNIPGPLPRFFFGHYKTLWSTQTYSQQLQAWTSQFGPIYGLFEGTRPMYVVSNVEFVEQVFVKQFSSFHSRRRPFVTSMKSDKRVSVFNAKGETWRRQRYVINPIFSGAKLKFMSPLVHGCIQAMMTKLSESYDGLNNEVNIYALYQRLTMDVICKWINKHVYLFSNSTSLY